MSDYAIKQRGYSVRESMPPGTLVTVTQEVVRNRPIGGDWDDLERVVLTPGDEYTVVSYSNAGFNGILASLQLADGSLLHNVEAGVLERA